MALASPELNHIYFSAGFYSLRPRTPEVFAYRGVNKRGDRSIDFLVENFPGSLMQKHQETLQGITTGVHQDVFEISPEQAMEEVDHNFRGTGRNRFKGRSIILARLDPAARGDKQETPPPLANLLSTVVRTITRGRWDLTRRGVDEISDDYIGYSAQETWLLPVEGRSKPLSIGYISDIAIRREYRRLGVAAYLFNVANASLRPDIIVMRIRSGAVVAALEKSKITGGNPSEGGNLKFALDISYDDDPIMQRVLDLADKFTIHPHPISKSTGVTNFVYAEGEDRAYVPDPTHAVASAADKRMYDMGVRASQGGAAYISVWVKGREIPILRRAAA